MTCPYCKAGTPGLEPCFPECAEEDIDAYEEYEGNWKADYVGDCDAREKEMREEGHDAQP